MGSEPLFPIAFSVEYLGLIECIDGPKKAYESNVSISLGNPVATSLAAGEGKSDNQIASPIGLRKNLISYSHGKLGFPLDE